MCITVNKAALSSTKIMSLTLDNGRQFIAYSNKVDNLSGEPNSMILPIPGVLKQEWFHNTEKYNDFMDDIIDNTTDEDYTGIRSRGLKGKFLELSYDSFSVGMYKIGIAASYEGIQQYIDTLPENERPKISNELSEFFKTQYAGWSFVVCAFAGNKKMESQPIAFEYEPLGEAFLYFPTMDAHDGGAPNVGEMISVDHTFIYEHTGEQKEDWEMHSYSPYKNRNEKPEYPEFLKNRKFRCKEFQGKMKNGDTYIKIEEMNKINFLDDPMFYRLQPVPAEV